jgi:prepilin-type N-terminal cleavage/methylation domain-containing protein
MSGIPSKRDSGYTLVEVLVAMTVVSILAAIAIPRSST